MYNEQQRRLARMSSSSPLSSSGGVVSESKEEVTQVWRLVMSIHHSHIQSQSQNQQQQQLINNNSTGNMLVAAATAIASSAVSAVATATAAHNDGNKSIMESTDDLKVEISLETSAGTVGAVQPAAASGGDSPGVELLAKVVTECQLREEYSSVYLTVLICLVTIGLTASLFVLTIIGWFPDLSSNSKHICQAYSLLCNMVALVTAGFVVLSTFVPSYNACNLVLILVHFAIFLFLSSELLVHLDFYTAIVTPFWHEETVAGNETAATMTCALHMVASAVATAVLYFVGILHCSDDNSCFIIPIMNMSQDGSTSMVISAMLIALFCLVMLTTCHIFGIAIQKLRANSVVPAAANNLSGTTQKLLVSNGAGLLMYEDDPVSQEVKSVSRTPFADPTFLHAIGSSFLERVSKSSNQRDNNALVTRCQLPDLPPEYQEPQPSTSRAAILNEKRMLENAEKKKQQHVMFQEPEKKGLNVAALAQTAAAAAAANAANNANTKNENGEQKDGGPQSSLNVELWRALTKSFRYTLVNIATYVFLLLPSSGLAMVTIHYTDYIPNDYLKNPTGEIFLPSWLWRLTMFFFVLSRTAQPIILAKMDKVINNKIGVIISDDV